MCSNEFYRCRGNTLTMCEFHESTCNGFGDIWWTDNPIYFSSIDNQTRWNIQKNHSCAMSSCTCIMKYDYEKIIIHNVVILNALVPKCT